jgi:hypothetical protein
VRAGHVTLAHDEFVKDGTTIAFQRVHLTRASAPLDGLEMVVLCEPSKAKRPWRPRRAGTKKGTTKGRPTRRKKSPKRAPR